MRCGIAVWTFRQPGVTLCNLIERFAGMGFEAVSCQPKQILELDGNETRDLTDLLRDHSLKMTVHASFELAADEAGRLLEVLGDALLCLTFDAARTTDSIGTFFDAARMAALLGDVRRLDGAGNLKLAVEDFPLDVRAMAHYRDELGDLANDPNYGTLIDIGHMNIRLRREPYFAALSVRDYLAAPPRPIVEVHLHDNDGTKDSHGHFGFGNVDFAAVAAGLRAVGFDGVATIEIAPRFHGSTPETSLPLTAESLATWRRLWPS